LQALNYGNGTAVPPKFIQKQVKTVFERLGSVGVKDSMCLTLNVEMLPMNVSQRQNGLSTSNWPINI